MHAAPGIVSLHPRTLRSGGTSRRMFPCLHLRRRRLARRGRLSPRRPGARAAAIVLGWLTALRFRMLFGGVRWPHC